MPDQERAGFIPLFAIIQNVHYLMPLSVLKQTALISEYAHVGTEVFHKQACLCNI